MNPSSNSPGLNEVIEMTVDYILNDVHTCMPGQVVSYDASKQTATVQPAIKRVINGVAQPMPQIHNVPVVTPATSGAWLLVPVSAGDNVLLHFSGRSIDQWWQHGGQVDPQNPAKFSLTDCIAVPGLNPSTSPISRKGSPSSVELANGAGWLEITPAGKFKLTNGAQELLTVLDNVLSHLIGLSTTNAIVGSPCLLSPATIEQLTADQLQLEALKA